MKKTVLHTPKVIIEVQSFFGQVDNRDLEDIIKQIKRHVDFRGHVYSDWTKDLVCEHCGSSWTEEGDYNGGCCGDDENNNPNPEIGE